MHFYVLQEEEPKVVKAYVNRVDFDNSVNDEIDLTTKAMPEHNRAVAEKHVRQRTRTCTSLNEVDAIAESWTEDELWHEAGRSHDYTRPRWWNTDYRTGNAALYRLAAASLRKADQETMGYDQGYYHDPNMPKLLALDEVATDERVVSASMASEFTPCDTAACVAGHTYVCSRGWQSYLQACMRSVGGTPTNYIGLAAAKDLDMSPVQHDELFAANPDLSTIISSFGIADGDWTCPPEGVQEIERHWPLGQTPRPEDMALLLEAIANRVERAEALAATVVN